MEHNDFSSHDIKGFGAWWAKLSPVQRWYFYAKARYYYHMPRQMTLGVVVFLLVSFVGLLVYLESANVALALIVFLIAFVLGVLTVWEVERRK